MDKNTFLVPVAKVRKMAMMWYITPITEAYIIIVLAALP